MNVEINDACLQIIPAIDLKNGKCVRLRQGEMDKTTVFSGSPPMIARKWQSLGAQMLHLIDLDGAFAGKPRNKTVIQEIREVIHIPIQLGGGIRGIDTIAEYLAMGIDRVILGTAAYDNRRLLSESCSRFPGRIVVGIDARNGKVAVKGWAEQTPLSANDLARLSEKEGASAIIYTDITRDGMLTGINLRATQQVAQAVSIPVIASGGVATLQDVLEIIPLVKEGVKGVIVGRALYEGTIDLTKALQAVKNLKSL